MLLRLFFCSTIFVVLIEGTKDTGESYDTDIETVKNNLDRAAELAVITLKAKLSQRIDSQIEKGLAKLEGLEKTCFSQGHDKLNQLKLTLNKELSECSEFIPATYDDAKGIVKLGGYAAMWIAGTVWDMVGGYEPCFDLTDSNQTLPHCLFEATTNVFDLISDDGIIVVKYTFAVAGFIFKTVLRVWACLDQELVVSSVQKIVNESQLCQHSFNTLR